MPRISALFVLVASLQSASRATRVAVVQHSQSAQEESQEDLNFESLIKKQGSGGNATFDFAIAGGNAIGRLHLAFMPVGTAAPKITNQGFAKETIDNTYWKFGAILGKDDDTVWPISPEGFNTGPVSFTFDHGVSDLVFGDLLDSHDEFHRMEFDELVYRKVPGQNTPNFRDPFQLTADQAVNQHLAEEIRESSLTMGQWHSDGYFTPHQYGLGKISYSPRLRAKKNYWEDVGSKFNRVTMQRPSIMDIDNLFVEDPNLEALMVRTSVQVNKDASYQGGHGKWPSLGKCRHSKSIFNRIRKELGEYYCGRTDNEQCASKAECDKLGGRWKEKYCKPCIKKSGEECGCCKEMGQWPTPPKTSEVSARMYVEWLAPLLKRYSCVPLERKYAKTGASSLFIAMGWGTEGDVESLDIDLSLVPLTKHKRVIKNKIVFFNDMKPRALACRGFDNYGMRAFNDDRSGDSPGDDELVKVNLACLANEHPDIDAVAVMANIYKPRSLTWNMLDSVYMRFIAGGQEHRNGDNFYIRDSESVTSFVRLTADAVKADPNMENNGLIVGMFFKDAQGAWAFAGLMEGVHGHTAFNSIPQIEQFLRGLSYPISEGWGDSIGEATDDNALQTAKCVKQNDQIRPDVVVPPHVTTPVVPPHVTTPVVPPHVTTPAEPILPDAVDDFLNGLEDVL